jgi:protein TonB
MENNLDLYTATLDEIVFESRNKSYGGYFLRVWYDKNVTKAALITSALFILFASSILAYYKATEKPLEVYVPVKLEMDLSKEPPIPEEERKKLPPPPPKMEQPKIETVKFLPPVIKVDKEVVHEEQIIEKDSALNSNISTVTQEGDKDLKIQDFNDGSEEGVAGGTGEVEAQVYSYVGEMPKFKGGGDEEVVKYVQNRVIYPADAKARKVQGTVFVEFIITPTGEVTNVHIVTGKNLDPSCDAEAMRVIKNMPKWEPGKNNGVAVPVRKIARIKFTLQN